MFSSHFENLNGQINVQQIASQEKINRPMNSFMLYKRDQKHAILAKYPGINFREVSKIVADSWKNEDPAIKRKYSQLAAEESRAHKLKYPNYKYPSSIGKKKKKEISSKIFAGENQCYPSSLYSQSDNILSFNDFKQERDSGKKVIPQLFQLNTKNFGQDQLTSIPNSPKDLFVGTVPVTNTLLSPVSFSFERDPALTAFFSSWDFSQFSGGATSNLAGNTSGKSHQVNIQSSLAAHLSSNGVSAFL